LQHYKGYQAYGYGTDEELKTVKGENNVVRVIIPAGFSGSVSVRFVSPYYWRVSEVISLISWAAVFIFVLRRLRIGNKHKDGIEFGL
ncbi:MAG: hypothetical protein LUG83_00815, partial [Lachnospiraceae bacterium]|nr:hypothetical protein [Lachnospiraceae bacterium]